MSTYIARYNPNRSAEWNYGGAKWRLSRSKIDLFLECPRCFYIDNKLGTKRPGFPAFNLNIAVDELFKKEFDAYRVKKEPHPLMSENHLDAVPFLHKDIDIWRDPFVGISYTDKDTGLVVSGGIDDVWVTPDDTLIMADYKSTSKADRIITLGDSPWEVQYARQLGVYKHIFEQNGFKVAETGYLVYANASKIPDSFSNTLTFETTLVPCEAITNWIPSTLQKIKHCLEADEIPVSGPVCEYCPYREASGKKLLALHQKTKKNS